MSYHVVFHKAEEGSQQQRHQHCMRCHKAFDPEQNSSTACVLLTPSPFMGRHTTNAKDVDYTNFDICHPVKCGKVLYSFTFHLRLIQEETKTRQLEMEMDWQDQQYDQVLQDQLEFLQKLKMRTANREEELNPKRVEAVNQQYREVMEMMIDREKEKLELEAWTAQVLNPSYKEKERQLFLKAPKAERKAQETWARIEQAAKEAARNNFKSSAASNVFYHPPKTATSTQEPDTDALQTIRE